MTEKSHRHRNLMSGNERKHQASTDPQRVDPLRRHVSNADVHEYGARIPEIEDGAVTMHDLDMCQIRQVGLSARCKFVINFDCCHMTVGTDYVREDRTVVSGAISDVDHPFAALQLEIVEPTGKTARQTVVEQSLRKNPHQNVVVNVAGMRVRCQAITEIVGARAQTSFS